MDVTSPWPSVKKTIFKTIFGAWSYLFMCQVSGWYLLFNSQGSLGFQVQVCLYLLLYIFGYSITCKHVYATGVINDPVEFAFCIRWHMGRVGWVGWGWWRFFHLHTCDMLWTWRFLHLHTCDMLRKSWGGLGGWGGGDDVSITCTHVTCYALDVSCTFTHVTCYASHGEGWVGGVGVMTFLSLAHMWHATHLTFLALSHMWHATHLTFLALAHMWHATQVMGKLGNQSLNVALWNLPVFPTTKCSLQSGTLKLDWQGLKR